MTDQQINKLYSTVARESWRAVNDAADEFNAANGDDCADVAPYLYVFADGSWTIDYPDYISTTNGCISAVMVYHVNGPAELADAIEAEEDWDAIEVCPDCHKADCICY
jgi:hypothetical protein